MASLKDKPEEYWKQHLTDEQYEVLREKGTEAPFTGAYIDNHDDGTYRCAACGQELFASDTKFESGSGWPSFTDPINTKHLEFHQDTTHGMLRTEIACANCGAHLGHVFDDGPVEQGGLRYCVNSISLDFEAAGKEEA